MSLNAPQEKAFERKYMAKFDVLANQYGLPIEYKEDSAAIDRGIHLVSQDKVTNIKIWFQFKGLHEPTLSQSKFQASQQVSLQVKIRHLQAWYESPEAVYLFVYIESADLFLAEDVRAIVNRVWGDEILNPAVFTPDQETVSIKIPTTAVVDESFWQKIYKHRSMRTDGAVFRGRPLGHNRDPLAGILRNVSPSLFLEIVNDLLIQHGYDQKEALNSEILFLSRLEEGDVILTTGILYDKYEIFLYMTNQIIPDSDGYRSQGDTEQVQGKCAVLIHSNVTCLPDKDSLRALANKLMKEKQIFRLLVFVNGEMCSDKMCFAEYRMAFEGTDFKCLPQHIEDVSINFTLTTNTYNKFIDQVSWLGGKVHRKEEKLFILPPSGGLPIPLD